MGDSWRYDSRMWMDWKVAKHDWHYVAAYIWLEPDYKPQDTTLASGLCAYPEMNESLSLLREGSQAVLNVHGAMFNQNITRNTNYYESAYQGIRFLQKKQYSGYRSGKTYYSTEISKVTLSGNSFRDIPQYRTDHWLQTIFDTWIMGRI